MGRALHATLPRLRAHATALTTLDTAGIFPRDLLPRRPQRAVSFFQRLRDRIVRTFPRSARSHNRRHQLNPFVQVVHVPGQPLQLRLAHALPRRQNRGQPVGFHADIQHILLRDAVFAFRVDARGGEAESH